MNSQTTLKCAKIGWNFAETKSNEYTIFGGWRGIMNCSLFQDSCSKISIIPLFKSRKSHYLFPKNQGLYSIIPLQKFPLFHYSIIPVQKISLFRYSRKTKAIIPLQKFPLFLFHYSSSPPEQLTSVQFYSSVYFLFILPNSVFFVMP